MSNSSGDVNNFERPSKTLKTNPSNTGYPSSQREDSSFPYILYFNNEDHGKSLTSKVSLENQRKETKRNIEENKKTDSITRSSQHNKDHIIAERKRRQNISQHFIALSALIPGLKKMDKASVLRDAIKHVKQLQEQVKLLEEKNQRLENVEYVVYVESKSGNGKRSLPEVEARMSEKNVLIRIHCEKQKGVLVNIIKEIENLNLSITSATSLLFGTTKLLDITVIAEMDEEFSLCVQELVRNLRVSFLQFME